MRAGEFAATPHELAVDKVRDALRPYAVATTGAAGEETDEKFSEVWEAVHV